MVRTIRQPAPLRPIRGERASSRFERVPDLQQHIVLENISWGFYERLLKEIGDRPIRMNFDNGRLEIMSPLSEHERIKKFIARLLEMLTFILKIDMSSGGSTTFRHKDLRKGLEPDECYFFKNADRMRGVTRWNAKRHPPPDLAIEVDILSRSVDREPIYAALRVPELWRWDGAKLRCLHLNGDHYMIREKSLSLPFLAPSELTPFILRFRRRAENAVLEELIDWIRKQGWAK